MTQVAAVPAPAGPGTATQGEVVLRTAAVWGTTVVAARLLESGQAFAFGEGPYVALARPDGVAAPDVPIRAVGNGWELDPRGATSGKLLLRGRDESATALATQGSPVPIVAGDHGVLQYGAFSIFFQYSKAPPKLPSPVRIDWGLIAAFFFSVVALAGVLLMLVVVRPPGVFGPGGASTKPLELTSREELLKQLDMEVPATPVAEKAPDGGDKGKPDPGRRDKKAQGGGKKAKGAEGTVGSKDAQGETKVAGDVGPVGGVAEALMDEDVAKELKQTLAALNPMSEELGGLGAEMTQFGFGSSGSGLKGSGTGGGGKAETGTLFAGGDLKTGAGVGKGGGYGRGADGLGGKGKGGPGRGGRGDGNGTGNGTGTGDGGERKVAGGSKKKAGQGLSPGQISRIVNSRYGSYRACYEIAASSNPKLKGCVSISFSITPGGSVASASVASNSLGNSRAAGCIARVFRRLHFPTADKATNAGYPICFKPRK